MQWETLYKEYSRKIFGFYFNMTGDHYLSEELTQETFFQAVISIYSFKGNSKVSTWLFGIARNVYLKHRRKASLIPRVHKDSGEFEGVSKDCPERRYEIKERNELIYKVLRQLPDDYRTVIILREANGLDYIDIGYIMNKSPDAARVTLFRAKKRFREIYEQITMEP